LNKEVLRKKILEHFKLNRFRGKMAKGGSVGKDRNFIVKIDLYERYVGNTNKKKIKIKAKNIYDLFEKLNKKSGDISYYI
jgi:hypothetical protein